MRKAGKIVALVLEKMAEFVRPQVSTSELDAIALDIIYSNGSTSAFLGYRDYPAAICTSVNDQAVHGIPSPAILLAEGDIVSIDVGVSYGGWMADACRTFAVGEIAPEAQRLLEVAEEALWAGIEQARSGNRLGDVSAAIQTYVATQGMSVMRELTGHGIGQNLHEQPDVLHYGRSHTGPMLHEGLTLAIEPAISLGGWRSRLDPNGWTVSTADGSLCAHFEHTLAITQAAAEILTLL